MKLIIPVIVAMFSVWTAAMAHSVNFETEKHYPAVSVKVFFTRTSPLANASVMIYAPGDSQPFQTGRTDKAGFFAFLPDASGDWTLAADDERGHTGRIVISITEDFLAGDGEISVEDVPAPVPELAENHEHEHLSVSGIPAVYRILFGLSVIFGITGTLYGVKARKELQRNKA